MDPFKRFLENTPKKGKSIEQIALSDYDYFQFLIKKAFLPSYEKKHGVELREPLADLYLDLNDFVSAESCGDCEESATLVRIQKEQGSLYGALRSYCDEHAMEQNGWSSQLSVELKPIMFNSRYSVSTKKDRKKMDKFLMESLGLKSIRSENMVKDAVGSLEHRLSGETREELKEVLMDYMDKAPKARTTQEYRDRMKNQIFELADEGNIFYIAGMMSPLVGEGTQIIYHQFKEQRESLKENFSRLLEDDSEESQERAALIFYGSSRSTREYLNTWFGYDPDTLGYVEYKKREENLRDFIE